MSAMPRRFSVPAIIVSLLLATGCDMDMDFSGLGTDGSFTGCYLCYSPDPAAPIPYDSIPVPVVGGLSFSALSVGSSHVCGISGDGTLCWGALDPGTETFHSAISPTPVAGAPRFIRLDAGNAFTCGLDSAGRASCWGVNPNGELGIGAFGPSITIPADVVGGHAFSQVGLSGATNGEASHACGLTPAGAAWCWGSNMLGSLGNGSTLASGAPVPVSGGHLFESLSVGTQFACAIERGGDTYCWGHAGDGRLGDDPRDAGNCAAPGSGALLYCNMVPVRISGSLRLTSIAAGGMHACGLDAGGVAWCWGNNMYGQLGTGSGAWSFEPVRVARNERFVEIAAGAHSTCGLTTDGRAFCWGNNALGQLGDGSSSMRLEPVPVATSLRFTSISVGRDEACALTSSGAAYCWGSNELGKLGKGS
jgi:alpha-tubulin suppressor-like RCC1 family protein